MRALSAVIGLAMAAGTVWFQPRESASCQSDIVSSTAVATFCGHRQGDDQFLDLYILWRGKPGWFQNRSLGASGGAGSRSFGAGTNGIVSQRQTYGAVTIAFEADFDANVVTIGQTTIKLDRVNAVVIDDVDGEWRTSATRRIEPRLPLTGDWNMALAQRSPEVRRDLQCGVPMPKPPAWSQLQVVTVCDKLRAVRTPERLWRATSPPPERSVERRRFGILEKEGDVTDAQAAILKQGAREITSHVIENMAERRALSARRRVSVRRLTASVLATASSVRGDCPRCSTTIRRTRVLMAPALDRSRSPSAFSSRRRIIPASAASASRIGRAPSAALRLIELEPASKRTPLWKTADGPQCCPVPDERNTRGPA